MKKYILQKIDNIGGILYLTMAPKKHGARLRFQPGQYATIGFRGANGRLSPMRCFSITSSSTSGMLKFATRLGGDFTHALANLTAGDEIFVQGPFGEFVIDQKYDKNIVMIAGGIGVTPFMSMIRSANDTQSSLPMSLLYSCRTGQGIPFHDELREIEKHNSNLRVAVFATDRTDIPEIPRMLSGRMTEKHIDQIVGGSYNGSTYFICGPKGFTENTESMLLKKGVPEDRIITESFTQASKVLLGNYNLRKLTYTFAGTLLVASIFSIAFLDLSRYVPAHAVSQVSTASTSSTAQPQQATSTAPTTTAAAQSTDSTPATTSTQSASDTPTTTTTSTSSNPSSTSSTSNSSSSASSNSQSSSYQQPVTSVS